MQLSHDYSYNASADPSLDNSNISLAKISCFFSDGVWDVVLLRQQRILLLENRCCSVLDVKSGTKTDLYGTCASTQRCVAVTSDESTLYVTLDCQLHMVDMASGQRLREVYLFPRRVCGMGVSARGDLLAVTIGEGDILLLDVARDFKIIASAPARERHYRGMFSVFFLPGDVSVATAALSSGGVITQWRARYEQENIVNKNENSGSSRSKAAATATPAAGVARLVEENSWCDDVDWMGFPSVSRDGRLVAFCGVLMQAFGVLSVGDAGTGASVCNFSDCDDDARNFSHVTFLSQTMIATTDYGAKYLVVASIPLRRKIAQFPITNDAHAIAALDDGDFLVVGYNGRKAQQSKVNVYRLSGVC